MYNWDEIMQRYRVYEGDGKFMVKKRFLLFFWRQACVQNKDGSFSSVLFNTLNLAESWIAADSQPRERRQWRRVK